MAGISQVARRRAAAPPLQRPRAMEPLPGVVALAAVFDRARGARLDAAERFVVALPQLFPGALVGCDLAWQSRAAVLAVVMRFSEGRFGPEARRRLDFWLGRAGVRSTALAQVSPQQRASFFANLEACQARVMGVAPDRLAADSADLFTAAGAPASRPRPAAAGPVLTMDVGGPGWEGVRYTAEERSLFIPGLLAPGEDDALTLSLRVPGLERPFETQARVAWVRRADEGEGARAGFALALLDAAPELLAALAARPPPAEDDEAGELKLAEAIAHLSARARRALVVDDDAVVRRMLQEALQQRGFEVLTADDGRTGLSMVAEELLALDLLVTDVRMRKMDGETFIRTIRRAGGEADLAIVAVTGGLEGELEHRLQQEGADAILDKALGPELIAQAADAVVERKRATRA